MFNKKFMLMAIFIVSLIAISAVSANDLNTTDDAIGEEIAIDNSALKEVDVDDVGTSDENNISATRTVNGNTFEDIQNAVDNANEGDTISLSGTYYGNGEQIVITKDLTINGNGAVLDAQGKYRMFEVQSYVVMNNINFYNGYAWRGGAIDSANGDGYLLIKDCTFVNNSLHSNGDGGAIFADGLKVINSKFINNRGLYSGGAVYSLPTGEFINCTFIGNTAEKYAGAIASSVSAIIDNCRFINNSAEWSGGAFCSFGGQGADNYWKISNSYFENNEAGHGGAISGASETVNCTFKNNIANGGSAIAGSDEIVDCIFENNSGSAIYLSDGFFAYEDNVCKVINSTFDNECRKYGSLYITYDNKLRIEYAGSNKVFSNYDCFISARMGSYDLGIKELTYSSSGSSSIISTPTVSFSLNGIPKGLYNCEITSYYISGNNLINLGNAYLPFTVTPLINIEAVNAVDMYYGGSDKLDVTLTESDNPLSNVDVKVNAGGRTFTVKTDSNGKASIPLDLPLGTHNVLVEYEGVSATTEVTVKSTIAANDASGTYLNSKVTATFLNTDGRPLASKQVTFKVGDKSYPATTNSNGVATANVDLGVGTYTVTAVNPVNNEEKQSKLVIAKANSAISLPSTLNKGATTLTATLTPASATGTVVFNVNGVNRNAQISNGKATLALKDLQAGNYTVTASYAGDNNLNPSKSNTITFNIAEVYPILTANDLSKTYGTGNGLVVNLVDSRGNAIANAIVNVNINGNIAQIKTDANGKATMPVSLAPGTYTATASYADARDTAKIVVKKAKVKMTAKAKTFKKSVKTKKYTITLKNNLNKVMKNTKVTIKVNKKTYTAKTNKKGVATFKLKKLTKKGKYTATITYKGSSFYDKLTKKVKITVK